MRTNNARQIHHKNFFLCSADISQPTIPSNQPSSREREANLEAELMDLLNSEGNLNISKFLAESYAGS